MRKLKLQMQISLDGFVSATAGNATGFNWDNDSMDYAIANLADVDTVLVGRKTAPDFITYWANVGEKAVSFDYLFGRAVTAIPKIIFSKTLDKPEAYGAKVISGDLADEVNRLKKMDGKSMMAYGGAGFASSLIKAGLIDEYHLLVNPIIVGNGLPIFKELEGSLKLKLLQSKQLLSGTIVLCYEPA